MGPLFQRVPRTEPRKIELHADVDVSRGTVWFGSPEAASKVPLAAGLFALGGLSGLLLQGRRVVLTLDGSTAKEAIQEAAEAVIESHLRTGAPPFAGCSEDAPGDDRDTELMRRVQELLQSQINPAVAAHGGSISVAHVERGVVYLRMEGGCQGCASSHATLRQGVEVLLRRELPHITDVRDVTEHDRGASPYFRNPR